MIQPVDQLLAGTADAGGGFKSPQLAPLPTLWGALKVVAQTSGNARWAIIVGGLPKAFGRGDRIDIPILVQPAQSVQVQVTGAVPGAAVTGAMTGVAGATMDEIAAYISLVPNTITIDTGSLPVILGSVVATANATNSKSFPIPAGTISIGYAIDFSVGGNTPVQVTITGDQSTDVYRQDTPPTSPPVVKATLGAGLDTSVTLSVTAPVGTASKVNLVVWSIPITESVNLDLLNAVPVTFNGVFGPAAAAPWQAATASQPLTGGIGAGASQTAIAAPGPGIAIWLHTVLFIPGTAGTFGKFTLGLGGSSIAEWAYAGGVPLPFDFGGRNFPLNTALVITNDSGVNLASEAGMAAYTSA